MTEEPRTEESHKNWRDLCSAVIETKDRDELLELVTELNQLLERKEQGHDFRKAGIATQAPEERRC